MAIIRLQHIGAAVSNYASTAKALELAGLAPRDFRDDQGKGFQHDARVLLGNDCWLHVVFNWNRGSRVNRFLASRGPGLEHIALQSDGIEADVERLRKLDVPIFEDRIFDANDGWEAFVYPDDAIGFTVELIQPHVRSWGYPESERGKPVSDGLGRIRLIEVGALVHDVADATARFARLFGVESRGAGRVDLGNTTLALYAADGRRGGLDQITLECERTPSVAPPNLELKVDFKLARRRPEIPDSP